ncbi:(d)CMP kinase [Salidesulfovibrio brasiliensis]|uniref:(d)CMP kinase n=1 Tax=Salidesulfovibrio brasiliensis TaxID=221711 RepID=UPI0006CF6334|nr:(d)CMP kinase [Salidesulfovibrio brasiliensis]
MAAKRIVTIDGPAGVGKSTMAKRLAKHLAIAYLDTGAMFRATALFLGENGWELPEAEIASRLDSLRFGLSGSGADTVLHMNETPIGDEIRTEQVGMWASNVATLPVVRTFLKKAQQDLGGRFDLVAEGRDMGTVVFPSAPSKFFLDATVEVRAKRRFDQLVEMGKPADLHELETAIAARDHQDRNRATAPLKPAGDAVLIDTSGLTIEEVFQALVDGL